MRITRVELVLATLPLLVPAAIVVATSRHYGSISGFVRAQTATVVA